MAATHTVIVGSGIIGISTAYYLSLLDTKQEHHIHLVDPASVLFEHVASGKAGGFLARNWFSSSVAELGAFSFDLHKELAGQFDGRKKWGWSQSTVINLDVTGSRKKDSNKELDGEWDWIQSGDSRVTTAGPTGDEESVEHPPWLNNFAGARPLADRTSTAQLDPLRLCNFLLDQCLSRGSVRIHKPALIIAFVKPTSDSDSPVVLIEYQNTLEKVTVPCDNLIVTSGPWTSSVLRSLLPDEPPASFPTISSLSGASIVIRSKRWQPPESGAMQLNALFLSKPMEGFTPEVFSRVGGEIYIAGLNDVSVTPPSPSTYALPSSDSVDRLVNVAKFLCDSDSNKAHGIGSDFEVVSRGLCFRPTTPKGTPVIGQIPLGGGLYGKKFRLWVESGHGPWGICMSLGTGMVLSQMVLGRKTSVDVKRLQP
ncbi:nucleotide-binding domain-containing protein [Thelephora ganbajun]|uniref:Nucleotide-binding domain-containing protein n=1 Tax=Thelephora ganbajun TaxID=370292 RepID=A0ACB6ZFU7_THEGA|nr:nucleotide-binding domain-containing protein [Thelephora ganbajun]